MFSFSISRDATPYDYGLNHEGFMTGALGHLENVVALCKKHNIRVMIDLHAVPGGGSHCQSYSGWQVDVLNNSFWRGTPPANNR